MTADQATRLEMHRLILENHPEVPAMTIPEGFVYHGREFHTSAVHVTDNQRGLDLWIGDDGGVCKLLIIFVRPEWRKRRACLHRPRHDFNNASHGLSSGGGGSFEILLGAYSPQAISDACTNGRIGTG